MDQAYSRAGEKLEAMQSHLSSTLAKLTDGYKQSCYWFELFECTRKILLVGVPVAFPAGSSEQLFATLIICFITWGVLAYLQPYSLDSDNLLANLSQFATFIFLLSSIMLESGNGPQMDVFLTAILVSLPVVSLVANEDAYHLLQKFKQSDKGARLREQWAESLRFWQLAINLLDKLLWSRLELPEAAQAYLLSGQISQKPETNEIGIQRGPEPIDYPMENEEQVLADQGNQSERFMEEPDGIRLVSSSATPSAMLEDNPHMNAQSDVESSSLDTPSDEDYYSVDTSESAGDAELHRRAERSIRAWLGTAPAILDQPKTSHSDAIEERPGFRWLRKAMADILSTEHEELERARDRRRRRSASGSRTTSFNVALDVKRSREISRALRQPVPQCKMVNIVDVDRLRLVNVHESTTLERSKSLPWYQQHVFQRVSDVRAQTSANSSMAQSSSHSHVMAPPSAYGGQLRPGSGGNQCSKRTVIQRAAEGVVVRRQECAMVDSESGVLLRRSPAAAAVCATALSQTSDRISLDVAADPTMPTPYSSRSTVRHPPSFLPPAVTSSRRQKTGLATASKTQSTVASNWATTDDDFCWV